jgi:hypothetical protein
VSEQQAKTKQAAAGKMCTRLFCWRRICSAAMIFVLGFSAMIMNAQSACPLDRQGEFTIYTNIVALPVGYFLLVRNGDKVGAIRVTSVTQDMNTQPKVGEWIGKFTYESYYREGKAVVFEGQSTVRRTGELEFRRMKGIGFHSSHQPGNHLSRIGPWKFLFSADQWVFMSNYNAWNGVADRGFEVAPTSACDVSQIDVYDSRLKWYRINPNREGIKIPLSKLPYRAAPVSGQKAE